MYKASRNAYAVSFSWLSVHSQHMGSSLCYVGDKEQVILRLGVVCIGRAGMNLSVFEVIRD